MARASQRYAKLLKAQKLVKARDEAELEGSINTRLALKDEDKFLFSLTEKGQMPDFFNPLLVANRLERNARKEAILATLIVKQRKTLLQSSRRYDVIDKKRKAALEAEERKDLSNMLEEYVAAKIVKDTSLG